MSTQTEARTSTLLGADEQFCASCGGVIKKTADLCVKCGVRQTTQGQKSTKSWVVLMLLSFFLGSFGADRFYAGQIGTGFLKLLVFVVNLALCVIFIGLATIWIWPLIDFIIVLCGKMKDSERKYISH